MSGHTFILKSVWVYISPLFPAVRGRGGRGGNTQPKVVVGVGGGGSTLYSHCFKAALGNQAGTPPRLLGPPMATGLASAAAPFARRFLACIAARTPVLLVLYSAAAAAAAA